MRRAVLIYNPAAGINRRGDVVGQIRSILIDGGVEVELAPTSGPGDATEIARRSAAGGNVDTVLVFGGDGTLREAARALMGTKVALAPLSAGTTNVVTRSLGLSIKPRQAARQLLTATAVECDVGLCNDEPFLILASLGVDAAIMRQVSSRAKNIAGRGAVLLGGLRTLWGYDFPETTWETDGEHGSASFLAVANIAEYGGDFRLAPDASFFNHRLSLVTFTGRGRLAMIRFALNLVLGRHLKMTAVTSRPVTRVTLPGPLRAPLQLDGDYIELEPPLDIRLSNRCVRLLRPGGTVDPRGRNQ